MQTNNIYNNYSDLINQTLKIDDIAKLYDEILINNTYSPSKIEEFILMTIHKLQIKNINDRNCEQINFLNGAYSNIKNVEVIPHKYTLLWILANLYKINNEIDKKLDSPNYFYS